MPEVVGKGSTGADGKIEIDVSGEGQYEIRILSVDGKGGDGDGGEGDDDAPAGDDTPPDKATAGKKLNPVRQKTLDIARTYVGKISASRGSDGRKVGWQLLKDLYDTSYETDIFQDPNAAEKIPAPGKKYNSWCGIFALACAKKAGSTTAKWAVQPGGWGVAGVQPQSDTAFEPGDILVMHGDLVHHAILVKQEGGTIWTLDGNFNNQTVVERAPRPASDVKVFYRMMEPVYVDAAKEEAAAPTSEGPVATAEVSAIARSGGGGPAIIKIGANGKVEVDQPPPPPPPGAAPPPPDIEKNDVHVTITTSSGKPKANVEYEIQLPDGSKKTGKTGDDGVIEFKGLPQGGTWSLVLPKVDEKLAKKAS